MSKEFNDPSNRKLYHAFKNFQVPEYVANAPAEKTFEKLGSEWFADQGRRQYPVGTKADTWMSCVSFVQDKGSMEPWRARTIESRLIKEAMAWGIEEDFKPVEKETPETYDIDLNIGGKVAHTVKLANSKHWKEAAKDLKDNPYKLTYGARKQLATGLLNAPEELRKEASDSDIEYLDKAAGFGTCPRVDVGKALINRVAMYHRTYPEVATPLTKWAQKLPDKMDRDILCKTASLIDIADRATGTHRFYRKGVDTPEEMLFKVVEKTASELVEEAVTLMNGRTFSKTALSNRMDQISKFAERYLGEVPWEDPESMIDVIETLPKPDADALINSIDMGPEL